jgi:glycosyltransferase involved in cell wall biosynthesis
MTASTEAGISGSSGSDGSLDRGWREAAEHAPRAALPVGPTVVSCTAALGAGGLGRHLSEILGALERSGQPPVCICGSTRASAMADGTSSANGGKTASAGGVAAGPAGQAPRHRFGVPYLTNVLRALPIPATPGIRTRAFFSEFDAYAAQNLPDAEHLVAFNGQALTQFQVARKAGYESLTLVSANPHMKRLMRQHARARERYPIERSWAAHMLGRNLAEYKQADRILYASSYIRDSFLAEGFPEERLTFFPLTPDPRYERHGGPQASEGDGPRAAPERFEIVYVGSLTVHKGVPLLIDAVRRLPDADIGLRLVGGWATRGMRRFIEAAQAADGRIAVSPGDPLPHLRGANLYVHPAYEDGFGYAPAEALAWGVPLIVSEDTGMKDLIDSPSAGLVLPTGDLGALTEAIEAAYRGEILARAAPPPPAGL